MEHFQAVLDPRKQELLEARFLGARVSALFLFPQLYFTHFCLVSQSGVSEIKNTGAICIPEEIYKIDRHVNHLNFPAAKRCRV